MKINICDICHKEIKVRLNGFKIYVKTTDNKTLFSHVALDSSCDVCAECYQWLLDAKWEAY